jgi:hydroxymethylpyrimidine/phosphomethylpyrimidine kinase
VRHDRGAGTHWHRLIDARPLGRVPAIAGSDCGGGAGIQVDIKTIMAPGDCTTTAVTALTAQDTRGVHAIHRVPPAFVARQIAVVLEDIGADAVKTGMLGDAATIEAVCDAVAVHAPGVTLVVDPVLRATVGGPPLLADAALGTLPRRLLPMASVVTPNLSEAAALSGVAVRDRDDMRDAARALLVLGVPAVLVTGGHLADETVVDLLVTPAGAAEFAAPRIETHPRHRMHARERGGARTGAGDDAARCGGASGGLCVRGDRSGVGAWWWAWAAEPRGGCREVVARAPYTSRRKG